MLLRKEGLPEEGELVLCTVTKIHYHSVFVHIDEYDISGMLHISEVSPGRIRNLQDYVKEGKKIVCKVLRVITDRRQVDVSLRRVNEGQKKKKISDIKLEQTAEKIIEFVAKKHKKELKALYADIWKKISGEYESLFPCFNEVVVGDLKLESLGIDKALCPDLEEVIRQRIKPPEVIIGGVFTVETYESDGVEIIKKAFGAIKNSDARVYYKGAGQYEYEVKAPDYKHAEGILKEDTEKIISALEKHGEISFKRVEINA